MVKIPSSFVPSVDMQVGSPTLMQAQSPGPMQSMAGQQIQQFGQAVSMAGEGISRYADMLQDTSNEAAVRKQDLEFFDFASKELSDFSLTEMDATKDAYPKVQARLEAKRKELIERTENPAQSNMLSATLNRRMSAMNAEIDRHAGKQIMQSNKVYAARRAETLLMDASRDITGWATTDQKDGENFYRDQVDAALLEIRKAHPDINPVGPDGKPSPVWTNIVHNYMGKMVGKVVDTKVKDSTPESLQEASDYVADQYRRGYISEETRKSYSDILTNQTQERDAAIKASELLAANPKWTENDVAGYYQQQVKEGKLTAETAARQSEHAIKQAKVNEERRSEQRVGLVNWARGVLTTPVEAAGVPGGAYNVPFRSRAEVVDILQKASPEQFAELDRQGLVPLAVADAQGQMYREDPQSTVMLNNWIRSGSLKSQFSDKNKLQEWLYFRQSKEGQQRALSAWDAENGDLTEALKLSADDKLKKMFQDIKGKDPYDAANKLEFEAWRRNVQTSLVNWQTQNQSATNPNPIPSDSQLLQTIIPEAMGNVQISRSWWADKEMSYQELVNSKDSNLMQSAYVNANGREIYLKEMPAEILGEVMKNFIARGGGSRATMDQLYGYWDRIGRPMTKEAVGPASVNPQTTVVPVAPVRRDNIK